MALTAQGYDIDDFIVDLGEFEGPLDVLLDLARAQKVDLKKISILKLADQYLEYLRFAQARQLRIAAEYLVMAAWLTYLKSQLLLPAQERDDEDAQELARALADRLRTLEAIRRVVDWLAQQPQLERERLPASGEEAVAVEVKPRWRASLSAMLMAYGQVMARQKTVEISLERPRIMTVEQALERLSRLLTGTGWQDLQACLPPDLQGGLAARGAVAASFVASLELARSGRIDIEQQAPFQPIMIRRRS